MPARCSVRWSSAAETGAEQVQEFQELVHAKQQELGALQLAAKSDGAKILELELQVAASGDGAQLTVELASLMRLQVDLTTSVKSP